MQAHASDLRSEIETEWSEISDEPEPDTKGKDEFIELLLADWRAVLLREPVRVLLGFTEQMTRDPATLTRENVEMLREAGWSDVAIHDATQVISYFNYINRIADALGVELEGDLPDWQ